MVAQGSFTLSPTKLTVQFEKLRLPDETVTAPAVCQVCTATFLPNDDTAYHWGETPKFTIPHT